MLRARKNQIRPSEGDGCARAGNTRFSHNKDVARRAARARHNKIRPSQGDRRARAGNTRFSHNKDVARHAARARHNKICPSQGERRARAGNTRVAYKSKRKNQICPYQGGRRRGRAIPGSPITIMLHGARVQKSDPPVPRRQEARAGNTRFAHSKDVARRAARARKIHIRLSQGRKRRARAIPGSPITRMSRGVRVQKPDPSVSKRRAAHTGHTRFSHKKNVTRHARARIRSARLKATRGARGQYPVRP